MTIQAVVTVMLAAGALWKTVDLLRAPHDRTLRLLVGCLLLLTAGQVSSLPAVSRVLDAVTTPGAGKMLFNVVHMAGLCVLVHLLVATLRDTPRAYRVHLRVNALTFAVTLVSLTVAMAATPAALRVHTLATPYMAKPAIHLFYFVGNGYFVYAYLTSAFWALRHTRQVPLHLARGLRIMAVGLVGLAASSTARLIMTGIRVAAPGSHPELDPLNWVMCDGALAVVLVGIGYSAALQLVTHLRSIRYHRRMYQELTPLWTALTSAFPELVLGGEEGRGTRRRPGVFRSYEQFYRRLIECRDGLVRLSPYLARTAPDADLTRLPPRQLAHHIAAALALRPAAEDPNAALSVARVAFPAGTDVHADTRELVAVSRAYARTGPGAGRALADPAARHAVRPLRRYRLRPAPLRTPPLGAPGHAHGAGARTPSADPGRAWPEVSGPPPHLPSAATLDRATGEPVGRNGTGARPTVWLKVPSTAGQRRRCPRKT